MKPVIFLPPALQKYIKKTDASVNLDEPLTMKWKKCIWLDWSCSKYSEWVLQNECLHSWTWYCTWLVTSRTFVHDKTKYTHTLPYISRWWHKGVLFVSCRRQKGHSLLQYVPVSCLFNIAFYFKNPEFPMVIQPVCLPVSLPACPLAQPPACLPSLRACLPAYPSQGRAWQCVREITGLMDRARL